MSRLADTGSRVVCPPKSRWAVVEFLGLSAQRDHPLAGEGLGEPVGVAAGEDQVCVVE